MADSATLEAAIALELANPPVTATTPSCIASLVIALAASEGSLLLSAITATICFPSTPPLALASLKAIFAPLAEEVPNVALPPVISFSSPIFRLLVSALLPQPANTAPINSITITTARISPFLFIVKSPLSSLLSIPLTTQNKKSQIKRSDSGDKTIAWQEKPYLLLCPFA